MALVHLSIIIPTFNEEKRLPATLEAIAAYLERQEYVAEVLVADDGSEDGTLRVAQAFAERLPLRLIHGAPHGGKGAAVRRGMLEASGRWRLFSDADLSTPIEEIEKFWPLAHQGADVVIGSRALRQSQLEVRQHWLRECLGRLFNRCIRLIGLSGIRDTQCGFKLFSAEAAEKIFSEVELAGWVFDVEALLRARRLGYRIAEVPVRWINSPESKVRAVDALRILLDILRLRLRL